MFFGELSEQFWRGFEIFSGSHEGMSEGDFNGAFGLSSTGTEILVKKK